MAINLAKMQRNFWAIFSMCPEFVVVLVLVNLAMVTGHSVEHHKNHVCNHQHPKAHDVSLMRNTFISFSVVETRTAQLLIQFLSHIFSVSLVPFRAEFRLYLLQSCVCGMSRLMSK